MKVAGGIILCLFFSATVFVDAAPQLYVGAKGGASFSWITGADWEDEVVASSDGTNRGRFGAAVGGFVSAVFPSRYGLRVELLYAEHGGRVDSETGGDVTEVRFRSVMLDVSLLGERYFDIGNGGIFVFLGPTLLVLQGDPVIEFRFAGDDVESSGTYEVRQIFAATGGVGYSLPLGPGIGILETRYSRGLTGYERDKTYHNGVTALLGYALPF